MSVNGHLCVRDLELILCFKRGAGDEPMLGEDFQSGILCFRSANV